MFFKKLKNLNDFFIKKVFDFDLLLSLRGLACLCVIFTHAFVAESIIKSKPWLLWPFFLDGYGAVWVFFILSGYLMTKLFDTKKYNWTFAGLKKYYFARIRRIVPLYWFVIIMGAFLGYSTLIKLSYLPKLISILTFTQYFFSKYDFMISEQRWISQTWTLVIEMQYYLFAPFLAFIFLKSKKVIILPIILFLIYLIGFVNPIFPLIYKFISFQDYRDFRIVLAYLPFFFTGSVVVLLLKIEKIKNLFKNLTFLLPILLISLFLVPVLDKFYPTTMFLEYRTLFYLVIPGLIIGIFESFNYENKPAKWEGNLKSWFSIKKYLEKLGHLSYSAYLWHLAVIAAVSGTWFYSDISKLHNFISEDVFLLIRFLFTLFGVFLLSMISFHLVEQQGKKLDSNTKNNKN